jgi:hypothetical protein
MTLDHVLPLILPPGWGFQPMVIRDSAGDLHARVFRPPRGFGVLASIDRLDDNKLWLHLSVSRPNCLPTWEDLRETKNTLLGREKVAIQLLPKESDYVNAHPFTLHLWHCLEGPTVAPWG